MFVSIIFCKESINGEVIFMFMTKNVTWQCRNMLQVWHEDRVGEELLRYRDIPTYENNPIIYLASHKTSWNNKSEKKPHNFLSMIIDGDRYMYSLRIIPLNIQETTLAEIIITIDQ